VPGTTTGCEDGNPCTANLCDAVLGCVSQPLNSGACDDGDACTTGDHCRGGRCVGTAMNCDDGVDCTDDQCVAGACVHVPVDGRCDRGVCAQLACHPGDPGADRHGCVIVASPQRHDGSDNDDEDGGGKSNSGAGNGGSTTSGGGSVPGDGGPGPEPACTDDGVACTDDVCTAAGCQHVPVDSRCVPTGECTAAVCAPERPDHDAAGCAAGAPLAEAEECAEDGDACTVDVCRGGVCAHEKVAQAETCAPVEGAFRQAIALVGLTRGLMASAAGVGMGTPVVNRLGGVDRTFTVAARVLAGKGGGEGTALAPRAAPFPPTPAQERARVAFAMVVHTPRDVAGFMHAMAGERIRVKTKAPAMRDIRRRARLLLRGSKTLKAELKRLQKVRASFVR